MLFNDKKGVAIIIAFFVVTILLILGGIFILRSVGEKRAVDNERNSIQAFYIAEAGTNDGLEMLDVLINTDLMSTVNDKNPNVFINDVTGYVGDTNGIGFLIEYTEGVPEFTLVENGEGNDDDEAVFSIDSTALGTGAYQYTISVTENGDPTSVGPDMWDFPYNFNIGSSGTVSSLTRNIIFEGDFTVRVQRDNFARYALFTDHHRLESGTTVWFTDKTDFTGPVHTNERFSFAFNPGGTFDGLLTQHLTKARFYNAGWPVLLDANSNPPNDVPVLNAGFTRGVDEINLESSVTQADLKEQAWGTPGGPPGPNGIYIANDGADCTAGIYVKGDATIAMGVDAGENALYTITQGGTTKIITVDYDNNQTTIQTVGNGTETYSSIPDGVDDLGVIIYTDGAVNSLAGTVQYQSEVTIASQDDVVITDNILYSDFTPGPPPNATGYDNLLGVLSWGGDVRVGTSCPNDVNVHATIMARSGVFTVDNYFSPPPRGTLTLLGGVITQFYGAFGTFWGSGQQRSGYGRNFVYDSRMAEGEAPPYFPSMRAFIAFSNDIADTITWQEGGN